MITNKQKQLEDEIKQKQKELERFFELEQATQTILENVDNWLAVVTKHSRTSCSEETWEQSYNYVRNRCIRCSLLHLKHYGFASDNFGLDVILSM